MCTNKNESYDKNNKTHKPTAINSIAADCIDKPHAILTDMQVRGQSVPWSTRHSSYANVLASFGFNVHGRRRHFGSAPAKYEH